MTKDVRLNIEFIGINYAPEKTGIGPYTSSAAEHLAAQGHNVTVLTGLPHYPQWSVPMAFRGHMARSTEQNGVSIERLRHFVPHTQDALRRGIYELTFAVRVLLRRNRRRPDIIIAVVPTLLSAVIACQKARRSQAGLIVWLQDSMSSAASQSGMPGGRSVAGSVTQIERRVLSHADRVMVISPAFRQYAEESGVKPGSISVLPNWVHIPRPLKDRTETRLERGWNSDEVVVMHTGNMGLKQDLRRVVDAARLARDSDPQLLFVLMGDGSQRDEIEEYAKDSSNIQFLNAVDDEEYSNVLEAADILLINERAGVRDMSLPSKLTSYLASGRPIIASVAKDSATAMEMERSQGGVVTSSQTPESMLTEIRLLVADDSRSEAYGSRGSRYASRKLSAEFSLRLLEQQIQSVACTNKRSHTPAGAQSMGNLHTGDGPPYATVKVQDRQ